MLRRNIDTAVGLVNGAVGTVMSIRTHHITVQFDGMHEPHHVERVKSRFMVLKKIYVQRKQFPLILAFTVIAHKCQGLSLDCTMMDLSNQVFCAGMAYVALSRVRKLEKLHLVSFSPQAIKVSTKCLQEINRLRQTYRPDMAQYSIDEYIERTRIDQRGVWGSSVEMAVLAHMLGANIASYNAHIREYQLMSPGIIDPDTYQEEYSRPTMYIEFANMDHFNVILSSIPGVMRCVRS